MFEYSLVICPCDRFSFCRWGKSCDNENSLSVCPATLSPAVGGARVVTTSILCLFVLATLSPAVCGATVKTTSILLLLILLTLSSSTRGVRLLTMGVVSLALLSVTCPSQLFLKIIYPFFVLLQLG